MLLRWPSKLRFDISWPASGRLPTRNGRRAQPALALGIGRLINWFAGYRFEGLSLGTATESSRPIAVCPFPEPERLRYSGPVVIDPILIIVIAVAHHVIGGLHNLIYN